MDDRSIETRLCMRGHRKRPGISYCNICRAEAARDRYQEIAAAERLRKRVAYIKSHPNAKGARQANAPRGKTHSRKEKPLSLIACTHGAATLTDHGYYHCTDCSSYINPLTFEVVPANVPTSNAVETEVAPGAPEPAKKRGRKKKEIVAGQGDQVHVAAPVAAVFGAALSESVVGTPPPPPAVSSAPLATPAVDAPVEKPAVRKGRKAAGTPGDLPSISGNAETDELHRDPGPWHESLKCPIPTCFEKLLWAPHNIVVNGDCTYHYKCPADDGVAVTLFIDSITILA